MQKIPTLCERDETTKGHLITDVVKSECVWVLAGHLITDVVKSECAWVLAGEGVATAKLDGTNVRVRGGVLEKRQKPKDRDYDEASYVPCRREDPSDRWAWEAFDVLGSPEDGIYELVGPKIQGNPHGHAGHLLVRVVPVNTDLVLDVPRTVEGLRAYLATIPFEGIVFHHSDGRMAKIKRRDVGEPWPRQN